MNPMQSPNTGVGRRLCADRPERSFFVEGDHPIFGRPDKAFTDFDKAVKYANRLDEDGFENVVVRDNQGEAL